MTNIGTCSAASSTGTVDEPSSVSDDGDPPEDPRTSVRAGPAGVTGRLAERADGFQQRHRVTAILGAVAVKSSDDRASRLAGQISYAAFLAVFPLLLVLLTLVGIVLHGHPGLQEDVVDSALRQFPVVGSDLKANVHQLSAGNTWVLIVGLVWLLYGSLKLSRSAQVMMAVVWDIDREDLPRLKGWIPRAVGFLMVLGIGFVLGGALAGLGAFGRLGIFSAWIGLLLSLVVNVLMYGAAYAALVAVPEGARSVWPGAFLGGIGWTVLQFAGALLVGHQLRHLSSLYGTFATVLGLVWWIAIGVMITVFAAEFNVVLTRHLWPRSLRRRTGHQPS
jgi:YihY family inner membrane protein